MHTTYTRNSQTSPCTHTHTNATLAHAHAHAHAEDYAPSADHYANFNRALQDMLLQSGDDGFENATLVMLPAWPCDWDVEAKLWGPGNTSVEFAYLGGALKSLTVVPPERAAAVKWASCVTA